MAFDDEWAARNADAQNRQSARMSLNTAGPQPGAPGSRTDPDLMVHQDDLGAVGSEAFPVHGELRKHTDLAGAFVSSGAPGCDLSSAPVPASTRP